MYDDVFVEQLVRHKPRARNILIKALAILMGITVTLLAWLISPNYSYILFTAAWIGAYFIFRFQDYEFEYTFTNGDLDVDRIAAQRKRKRVLSTNCDRILLMAPYDEAHAALEAQHQVVRTVDYASSKNAPGRWFFLFSNSTGSAKVKVIFEPDRKLLQAMKDVLKGKVSE